LIQHSVAKLIIVSALTGENIHLPRKILWLVCYRTQYKEYIYRMNDPAKNFLADDCFQCIHTHMELVQQEQSARTTNGKEVVNQEVNINRAKSIFFLNRYMCSPLQKGAY
jgi:hypothetical protein